MLLAAKRFLICENVTLMPSHDTTMAEDLETGDSPPRRHPPTRQRRLSTALKWIVFLLLAAGGTYAWKDWQAQSTIAPQRREEEARQTIRDAIVAKGDVPIIIDALGTVTPLANVTVRTQIAGQLQQVGFQEGQMVKAGDFLAQVDPRPYQVALEQAQGQLAKDTALLAEAQVDLARYQKLDRDQAINQQQEQDQIYVVQQDKATVVSDQGQIDADKLNITYCHITAPVGGRVGLRQVDPGNYVQVTDTNGIAVITQIDPISVIFSTPEDNVPRIFARMKDGAMLPVDVYDRADVTKLASGSLSTVDNQIDTTTGTVKVRAQFDNKNGTLFPQQFVNVHLLVDTLSGVTVVPNAAVQQGADGSFAYAVKDDNSVMVRQLKVGPTDGQRTAVLSGLSVGEKVVIDGADRLREGAKVDVRNDIPDAATGAAGKGSNAFAQQGQGADISANQPAHAGHHRKDNANQPSQ
jgi:multidrug efflux system membrane fusion protein